MTRGHVVRSVSSWQQSVPATGSSARNAVIEALATVVETLGCRRVRVAIDGRTASGKTSLGHELAAAVARTGRDVFRASVDDFKHPWAEAHRYDRTSGEGYYRNAFDLDAIDRLLLRPAAADGSGTVALCSIDPITQVNHQSSRITMPIDGILIVDGVFALRPELNDSWDLRVWLEVDRELSIRRGIARDAIRDSTAQAETLHRQRYSAAEDLYIDEVNPRAIADIVIENSDLDQPRVLRP